MDRLDHLGEHSGIGLGQDAMSEVEDVARLAARVL
jgi:hypothetical protein